MWQGAARLSLIARSGGSWQRGTLGKRCPLCLKAHLRARNHHCSLVAADYSSTIKPAHKTHKRRHILKLQYEIQEFKLIKLISCVLKFSAAKDRVVVKTKALRFPRLGPNQCKTIFKIVTIFSTSTHNKHVALFFTLFPS